MSEKEKAAPTRCAREHIKAASPEQHPNSALRDQNRSGYGVDPFLNHFHRSPPASHRYSIISEQGVNAALFPIHGKTAILWHICANHSGRLPIKIPIPARLCQIRWIVARIIRPTSGRIMLRRRRRAIQDGRPVQRAAAAFGFGGICI